MPFTLLDAYNAMTQAGADPSAVIAAVGSLPVPGQPQGQPNAPKGDGPQPQQAGGSGMPRTMTSQGPAPVAPQSLVPRNVQQAFQSKGPASAGGAMLRSIPPKADQGAPKAPQAPGLPQQANLQPQGSVAQPAGIQDYTQQLQATANALPSTYMQPPPFTPPQIPQPNKYQNLGYALSALLMPKTAPFVESEVAYDQAKAEQDYKDQYQAALDQWKARADAAAAGNQGLTERADILKTLSETAPIQGLPQPPKPQGSPWQQHTQLYDYYQDTAAKLERIGTPQARSMATGYRQLAQSEEAWLNNAVGQESKLAKIPMAPGSVIEEGPHAGEKVTANSPQALAYFGALYSNNEKLARTDYLKTVTQEAPEKVRMEAQRIADTEARTAQAGQRIKQSASDQAANREERIAVAILGLEAGADKANAAAVNAAGRAALAQSEINMRANASAPAGSPQLPTNVAPAPVTNVDVNLSVPSAINAAKEITSETPVTTDQQSQMATPQEVQAWAKKLSGPQAQAYKQMLLTTPKYLPILTALRKQGVKI